MKVWQRWRALGEGAVVARGTAVGLVIRVAGIALAYGAEVALARLMGPDEYGLYSLVLAWMTLAALVPPLGLHHAVGRFIPAYIATGDGGRLRGVVKGSLALTLTLGVVLAAAAYAWLAGPADALALPQRPAWYVGIGLLPLLGLLRMVWAMAIALGRVAVALAPPLILEPVLVVALAYTARALGLPALATVVLGMAGLARGVELIVQGGALIRRGWPLPGPTRTVYELRHWLAVGVSLLAFDAFNLVLRQADLLLIGAMRSPAEVGIYGAALKTTGQVTFLLATTNAVVSPLLAAAWARHDRGRLQRLLYLAAHLSFWPALAVVLGLSLLARPVLSLFGPAFVVAAVPLIILALGQLVNAATGVVVALFIVTGQHWRVTGVFGLSAALYGVLTYLGVRFYGLVGAALATAGIMAFWNLWLSVDAARRLGLQTSIVAAVGELLRRRLRTG
jgi:O-antigen/teichoic acid export membrane protein